MGGARGWRTLLAVVAAGLIMAGPSGAAAASPYHRPAAATALPADTTSWIVTLESGADAAREAPGMAKAAGGDVGLIYRHALNGFVFKGSATAAAALQRNSHVRTLVPDGQTKAVADEVPTGVSRIRANHLTQPSAYGSGFAGAGVRVAILDTGIDLTHPDLVGNLDAGLGRNCITSGPPQDGHGHGTHVAGIVAATDNGSGIVGVAPSARLVPIKVLDDTGQGEWSNLICAIDYLTGLATDADPSNDVRVANMSLGDTGSAGSCDDGFVREAICTSVGAGIVYVAAAGNSTVDAATFIPAAYPEVITVSALTDLDGEPGGQGGCWLWIWYCDDTLAEFSNFGLVVDVTAPGTQIYSTWTGGGYATEMGTSMAAPHVSGVAALILGQNPGLAPADVDALLKSTGECANGQQADAAGTPDCVGNGQWANDPDGYGEPLVNALAAAEEAGGDRRPTIEITSPTDGSTVSGVVPVTADASDDVGVVKVDFFVNGSLAATDTDGTDGWSMLWDSTALGGGIYSLKATATDTVGKTRSDAVTVTAGTNVQGNWVGVYGADGYVLGAWNGTADLAALPAGVTYAVEQGLRHSWGSTSDGRALESPSQGERRATAWYDASQVRVRLAFNAAYSGTLHLYAVDWDSTVRRETVTIDDGSGPRSVNLSTSFAGGAWLHFPITVGAGGSVVVTVANQAGGTNGVLSGIFLGGAGQPAPAMGNWVGVYGADGYVLGAWNGTADLAALPAGVTYAVEQGLRHSWASSTADGRALESPSQGERRAAAWYDAGQVRIRLTFNPAYSGTVHLYAVDWDSTTRRETVTIDDGSGPRSVNLSTSFAGGAWIHFPVNVGAGGSVVVTVANQGGPNAVLSGIFLGGAATQAMVPGAPTGLTATAGNSQVVLAWTAPASNGGSPITGYTVTASPGAASCTTAGLGCTISGLTNGTAYTFTVVATNTVGNGPASAPATATPATVPGAPTGLTATAGNGQVLLAWTAPASNGGSPITSYTATASPGVASCTTAGLGCTVSGLTNGTAYTFTVVATNAVGNGPASAPTTATPATVPGAPTGLTATAGNGQVVLAWTAPASNGGSPITSYIASASPGVASCTTAGLGCTISGLTNGTTYTFTVVATNSVGTGTASAPTTAIPGLPPGAPTGLAATAGSGQVVLTWTAPASDGGSPITGYTVTASPGAASCTTAGLGCTISGLTNGTAYTFTVVATNAVGNGPASAPTTATPASVPGAPRNLSAKPNHTGGVSLGWLAPSSNGGAAITRYLIYRSTTSGTEVHVADVVGPITSFDDTDTTKGVRYYYRVSAVNAIGEGALSSESSAIAK